MKLYKKKIKNKRISFKFNNNLVQLFNYEGDVNNVHVKVKSVDTK